MPQKLQCSESVVLVGENPHKLRHSGRIRCLSVRSRTETDDAENVEYSENEDFIIDSMEGTIRRTANSAIPDWSEHVLYGKTNFNHRDYEDCSNRRYTVYADYEYEVAENGKKPEAPQSQTELLPRAKAKLLSKKKMRYVVFGDSISAGGDASREEFAFYERFAAMLRGLFPDSPVEVVNKAIGGENSSGALARLEEDVVALQPDLVSIGYGMNDQCTMSDEIRNGVPPEQFESNVRHMVNRIHEATDADIILITPCLSNPLWMHSSGDIEIYAEILKRIGTECGCMVADVHELWIRELQAGKTHESLLLNNINHPNDYGHRIYYEAFAAHFTQAVKEDTA